MKTAAQIVDRWNELKGERAVWESTWDQVARFVRPIRAEFLGLRTPGEKRNTQVFESTPLMAADNFAGGIYGMMTNPANRWFSLRLEDDDLNEYDPVMDWLYEVETRILNSFGPQSSRFYSVIPAYYADLACFGTSVFYSEEGQRVGLINDNVRALSECCIAESAWGDVDTLYRRYNVTARQAVQEFGTNLSSETQCRAEKSPNEKIAFIHCVEPNDGYEKGKLGPTGKPFVSIYVEEQTRKEVSRKGYDELPYQAARWDQAAGEVYGRGLGELILPDALTLTQMSRTSLIAAQKIADPPWAAPDEGVIKAARTYPGGITYGAIDQQGNQLFRPLVSGARLDITHEMMEQRRNAIREGFYFSLMQMIGSPNMTATEWMGRQEEKLRLMGKNLGRIQSEFLSPLIKRRFGLLSRTFRLPPPPPEIQGKPLNVEYVSPLARAQMASEANAVVRSVQAIVPMAQQDPGVWDNIDTDEAVQAILRGYGAPAKMRRGADQVAELRDQRQQQVQTQQMLAMAQAGAKAGRDAAGASKDFAQAQQTEGAA